MLQCVLTGRAQQAYSSVNNNDCLNYELAKAVVLIAYELVPEAYRQQFRSWKKGDMSHLEFFVIRLLILIVGAPLLRVF